MSDLQRYKEKRKEQNPKYWAGYEKRLETFKLGVLLKQARQNAGLTQEQVAEKVKLPACKAGLAKHDNGQRSLYCLQCLLGVKAKKQRALTPVPLPFSDSRTGG